MRLRKLLLGSTAAIFAGGVATTAQAADPQGLVVTTMAQYVEQCNDGDGWRKGDWCITISGDIGFEFTYGTTIQYSTDPWEAFLEYEGEETPETDENKWGNFDDDDIDVLLTATRETEHGDLTIRIPLVGTATGQPDLTIGPWRFNSNGVRFQQSFGAAQITVTVQNPGTLGWTDPRFDDDTDGDYFDEDQELLGPWPDVQIELGFDSEFAELDFGVNVGRRGGPFGDPFLTWGGYAQAEAGLGFGDLTVRFDWDKVNAHGDGTAEPVYAFGLRADLDIEVGDRVTIAPAFGWSKNYGYYGYKYDEHELGTYYFVELDVDVELSDLIELGLLAAFTAGPDRPEDRVLDLQAQLTFTPASASPLEIELTLDHERQLGVDNTLRSTRFTAGVNVPF